MKQHRVDPVTLALPTRLDVERAINTLSSVSRALVNYAPSEVLVAQDIDVTLAMVEERVLPRCLSVEHLSA